jgi:hypothetical protein
VALEFEKWDCPGLRSAPPADSYSKTADIYSKNKDDYPGQKNVYPNPE